MTWRALGSWRPSRIGLRLLAFNLLVVFVPVTGVFYLDAYETKLLQAQEREMVQQARVLAAVLGGEEDLDPDALTATFARLERRSEARLRVFDGTGVLVADSDRVPRGTIETPSNLYPVEPSGPISTRKRILYRLGAWLANAREAGTSRLRAWLTRPPPPGATDLSAGGLDVALREALAGRYGAATRATPGQRSLTLFSGLPIRQQGRVTGAVVVSQSTFRILRALYAVRLRLFEIVVASILVAAALTTLSATTIVRPLTRLRRRADALAQRRGTQPSDFPATNRRDEIGALARALQHLTRRLDEQIARLEAFASDVAHEFRNPLASIRAAADTISTSESAEERQRFLDMMRRDIQRLDRLVYGRPGAARWPDRARRPGCRRPGSDRTGADRRHEPDSRRDGLASGQRPGMFGGRIARATVAGDRKPAVERLRAHTRRNVDRRRVRDDRPQLPADRRRSRPRHPGGPSRTRVRTVLLVSSWWRSPGTPGAGTGHREAGDRGIRRNDSRQEPSRRRGSLRGGFAGG
jgi:HAMP domain-containing protein